MSRFADEPDTLGQVTFSSKNRARVGARTPLGAPQRTATTGKNAALRRLVAGLGIGMVLTFAPFGWAAPPSTPTAPKPAAPTPMPQAPTYPAEPKAPAKPLPKWWKGDGTEPEPPEQTSPAPSASTAAEARPEPTSSVAERNVRGMATILLVAGTIAVAVAVVRSRRSD